MSKLNSNIVFTSIICSVMMSICKYLKFMRGDEYKISVLALCWLVDMAVQNHVVDNFTPIPAIQIDPAIPRESFRHKILF